MSPPHSFSITFEMQRLMHAVKAELTTATDVVLILNVTIPAWLVSIDQDGRSASSIFAVFTFAVR